MSGTSLPQGQPVAVACTSDGDHAIPGGVTAAALARLNVDLARPATCAGCGCTDDCACPDGCVWLAVDRDRRSGICSNCDEVLDAWLEHAGHVGGGAS